jgi:hypothetical protein
MDASMRHVARSAYRMKLTDGYAVASRYIPMVSDSNVYVYKQAGSKPLLLTKMERLACCCYVLLLTDHILKIGDYPAT